MENNKSSTLMNHKKQGTVNSNDKGWGVLGISVGSSNTYVGVPTEKNRVKLLVAEDGKHHFKTIVESTVSHRAFFF